MHQGGETNTLESSVNTSDLPSTDNSVLEEQLLYTQSYNNNNNNNNGYNRQPQYVRPQPLGGGYTNVNTRPGWLAEQKVICYKCYEVDKHKSPECDLTLAQLGKVVTNYDSLSLNDKSRVPRTAYDLAKQFLSNSQGVDGTVVKDGEAKN